MIVLKNGYVIDPATEKEGYRDIVINEEQGVIEAIVPRGEAPKENARVIDITDCLVAPGLVDVHVHFRDPGFTYKEDIESGACAAAKGGFTSVVLMANTKPTVDTVETLQYVLNKGAATGINVYSCANVTKGMQGKELTDMESLSKAGAVGFTDDGIPLLSKELLSNALHTAGNLKKPISLHEEDPALISNNGIHAGKASAFYGIEGSPREAEIAMVSRDLELAKAYDCDLSIQHISTKEAVELVREAKKQSKHIYAEATPHHFTLTQEATIEKGSLAKMNPPLREEEDRMAIIKGLQDGTIDIIATDHAPHSREEKEKPITQAPSGIIGLETALSLGIRELVDRAYLSLTMLLRKMSYAPAQLYRLDAGYLAEGGPADLVVFTTGDYWMVNEFASKSQNSPFIGEKLPGVIKYTICRGKIVYHNGGKNGTEEEN